MNMKQLRERKKLRLAEVAYKVGVSEATVRNWEHARTIPSLTFEQTEILMSLYECSIHELRQAFKETELARGTAV